MRHVQRLARVGIDERHQLDDRCGGVGQRADPDFFENLARRLRRMLYRFSALIRSALLDGKEAVIGRS